MNKARLIVLLSFFSLTLGIYLTTFSYQQLRGYKTKAAGPPYETEADKLGKGKSDTELADIAKSCVGGCENPAEGVRAGNAAAALEIRARGGDRGAGEAAATVIGRNKDQLATLNPKTGKYEFIDQLRTEEKKGPQKGIQNTPVKTTQTTVTRDNVTITCDASYVEELQLCRNINNKECCCGLVNGGVKCASKVP